MAFDSQLIEAKLALGRISPDEMPALAWDAMEQGFDGPVVRRLAALLSPSGWETDRILPAFMREAGLQGISKQEAAVRLARHLAHRIVSLGLDPVSYTRDFELLWIEADYSLAMRDLGSLDDEKHVAEYLGRSEDEFREYARDVLAKLVANDHSQSKG